MSKRKNSIAYMQSLPADLHEELQELCYLYNSQNSLKVNTLSLQEIVRLILKSHMQSLRGQTDTEVARANLEGPTKFIPGKCPRCLLRVDKRDFPVLVEESADAVRCHVCGTVLSKEEVPMENGW